MILEQLLRIIPEMPVLGGGQIDLYTHLLKFIKACQSHLRKGAINDRHSSRVFGTPVKNSKAQ